MEKEMRYAVLIDADNVAAKYTKYILDEVSNYGVVTYKRVYGDWTRPSTRARSNLSSIRNCSNSSVLWIADKIDQSGRVLRQYVRSSTRKMSPMVMLAPRRIGNECCMAVRLSSACWQSDKI